MSVNDSFAVRGSIQMPL